MTEAEREKRKFRQSKEWKQFREALKKQAQGKDAITQKPLHKGFQCHHQDLNKENYKNLIPEHFICCNRMTHDFIHWLYSYYKADPQIIDRIKAEMETMQKINAK